MSGIIRRLPDRSRECSSAKLHILSLGCPVTCPKIPAPIERTNVAVTTSDIFVLLDKFETIFTADLNRRLIESEGEARLAGQEVRIEAGGCWCGRLFIGVRKYQI